MNNNIIKTIFCLLSFSFIMGISISDVSALTISGCIDKRPIKKVIRLHENEIRHCYNTALIKDKTLTGKIVTQFIILSDGSVEKAWVKESTLNNPEVEECVTEHIKKWKFYVMRRPQCSDIRFVVEYPYDFVSDYKPPTVLEHIQLIFNEDDMKIEYFEVPPSQEEN